MFLMRLSDKVASNYRKLGIYLGIEDYTIDAIKADYTEVAERTFKVLETWKYACKTRNSCKMYNILCNALSELGRNDLVDYVRVGKHTFTFTQCAHSCLLMFCKCNRWHLCTSL